ncbi:MAG: hypothetical protein SVU69_00295 [Pseudomonadota bacterium]|nr:hypothetical protein [Pseudomonadota bacterium]
MRKLTCTFAFLSALMVLPFAANAEIHELTDGELSAIYGQGYILMAGDMTLLEVPYLSELTMMVGPVNLGDIGGMLEDKYPALFSEGRDRVVDVASTLLLGPINFELGLLPFGIGEAFMLSLSHAPSMP